MEDKICLLCGKQYDDMDKATFVAKGEQVLVKIRTFDPYCSLRCKNQTEVFSRVIAEGIQPLQDYFDQFLVTLENFKNTLSKEQAIYQKYLFSLAEEQIKQNELLKSALSNLSFVIDTSKAAQEINNASIKEFLKNKNSQLEDYHQQVDLLIKSFATLQSSQSVTQQHQLSVTLNNALMPMQALVELLKGGIRISNSGEISKHSKFSEQSYTATGTGTTLDVSTTPVQSFSIEVEGIAVAATSWTVVLEGSLDNENYTTLLTHNTATGNKEILYSGATLYPSRYFRSRCSALTLGSATSIDVKILGAQ